MPDITHEGDPRRKPDQTPERRHFDARLSRIAPPTERIPRDKSSHPRTDRRDGRDARDAFIAPEAAPDAHARLEQQLRTTDELNLARTHQIEFRLSAGGSADLQRELDAIDAHHARNPTNATATGERGEAIAKAMLAEHGLPDTTGHWRPVDAIVSGQYDRVHGIDLVAVQDGKPIPIEVKYTQLAVLSSHVLRECDSDADPTSYMQMGDNWTLNRWNRLIHDESKGLDLIEAGVDPKYYDPVNFDLVHGERDHMSLEQELLSNKRIVIVSDAGTDAIRSRLVRQCRDRAIRPEHILTIRI